MIKVDVRVRVSLHALMPPLFLLIIQYYQSGFDPLAYFEKSVMLVRNKIPRQKETTTV